MTWHLTDIPKKAYFYWGTQTMPFVRYLTLETFRKFHPDWEIILHRKEVLDPSPYVDNCWHKVDSVVDKVEVFDVEKEFGVEFPLKMITIFADTYRYLALDKTGGLYMDMDHLIFKNIESMAWNTLENNQYDAFILKPPYHHFVVSKANTSYNKKITAKQKEHLPTTMARVLDVTACTEWVKRTPEDKVLIIPFDTTEENFDANGPKSKNAFALNWHGSGACNKYDEITEANYMESDHPLAACIRYCLTGNIGKANGIGTFDWIERYG